MKYRSIIFILCISLLSVGGCKDESMSVEGRMITLGAHISSSVESRADLNVIDYDTQTGELEIGMIRWDETDGNHSCVGRQIKAATMGNPVATDSWKRLVTPTRR